MVLFIDDMIKKTFDRIEPSLYDRWWSKWFTWHPNPEPGFATVFGQILIPEFLIWTWNPAREDTQTLLEWGITHEVIHTIRTVKAIRPELAPHVPPPINEIIGSWLSRNVSFQFQDISKLIEERIVNVKTLLQTKIPVSHARQLFRRLLRLAEKMGWYERTLT